MSGARRRNKNSRNKNSSWGLCSRAGLNLSQALHRKGLLNLRNGMVAITHFKGRDDGIVEQNNEAIYGKRNAGQRTARQHSHQTDSKRSNSKLAAAELPGERSGPKMQSPTN